MDIRKLFGTNVKRYREAAGLSQAEIAARMGVDRAYVSAIERGVEKRAAILDAVHKRARPIVMTTIAMTAGMVPSALGTGEGAEFSAPMAIAVIGGLLLSTLLSLLFVPSLFSIVHGGQVRIGNWLVRRIGLNSAPE